jgi:hypothetical protein
VAGANLTLTVVSTRFTHYPLTWRSCSLRAPPHESLHRARGPHCEWYPAGQGLRAKPASAVATVGCAQGHRSDCADRTTAARASGSPGAVRARGERPDARGVPPRRRCNPARDGLDGVVCNAQSRSATAVVRDALRLVQQRAAAVGGASTPEAVGSREKARARQAEDAGRRCAEREQPGQ